jgi:xanthine dehydrogenase accessory factor
MIVLLRGGGDLASGVALRLSRAGLLPIITEIPQPLAVRRLVSFAEAIYQGEINVEGIRARRASDPEEAFQIRAQGCIPVLVDPGAESRHVFCPKVFVDGRMTKLPPDLGLDTAPLVIGLGPGFSAGENCHAVVETNRGHSLGRAIWQGPAEADTGLPEAVGERWAERVLRAPAGGVLEARIEIGAIVEPGEEIARVGGLPVLAPFRGALRGLLHPGILVKAGLKIGDLDPRSDPRLCRLVSDKSLAIGGGVLEAILSRADLRPHLWD